MTVERLITQSAEGNLITMTLISPMRDLCRQAASADCHVLRSDYVVYIVLNCGSFQSRAKCCSCIRVQ